MRKVKIKNLVIFLLCFVLLALFEPFGDASAYAAINRSISSESDKVARIDDDGTLKFVLTAQAASSGTRWKTVGLYVTSDPTGRNGKESTKAKDCVFLTSFPKVAQNQIESGEILLLLPSPSPKKSLTACVTKPV